MICYSRYSCIRVIRVGFHAHLYSTLFSPPPPPPPIASNSHGIRTILLVKKTDEIKTNESLLSLSHWICRNFQSARKPQLLVEKLAFDQLGTQDTEDSNSSSSGSVSHLRPFIRGSGQEKLIDLIVTLGGDGTLLHVNSIFQSKCPPILSFSLGSLGFLMPFDFTLYPSILTDLLSHENGMNNNFRILNRMRLQAVIYKKGKRPSSASALNNEEEEEEDQIRFSQVALNDVVLHRGRFPKLVSLECHIDGEHLTDAIADGLILATPTGSTAYSLSAGGSVVHPMVGCLLLTPLSPRSLSFRPAMLPENSVIDIKVSDSRDSSKGFNPVDVVIDGSSATCLEPGDWIRISRAPHPLTTIMRSQDDWVNDLNELLRWNQNFQIN